MVPGGPAPGVGLRDGLLACGVTAEPGPSPPCLALRSVVPFALVLLAGAHCLPAVSLNRPRVRGGQRDAHPHFHFAKAQPRAAGPGGAEGGPALPGPQRASLSSQQATCKTRPRPPPPPTHSQPCPAAQSPGGAGRATSQPEPWHVCTCFLRPLQPLPGTPRRALVIEQLPPGTCPMPGTPLGAGGWGMEETGAGSPCVPELSEEVTDLGRQVPRMWIQKQD